MNGAVVVAEAELERLIPRFYARVREDPRLGPVFNDIVEDWPGHLEKLVAFWSSVMLGSGRYKGNPVMAHGRHSARMPPELFARWLELWTDVTNEEMAPAIAASLQAKAGRIAESLQLAMFFRLPPASHPASEPA